MISSKELLKQEHEQKTGSEPRGYIRLWRSWSKTWLTILFEDVGVSENMSDKAIFAHVAAFYAGWKVASIEPKNGMVRFFS